MTSPVVPATALETTEYRAPLGLQFVDSVGGATVADGLVVTAWPSGDPGSARTAAQSPVSTIMGFGRLPGLYAYEEAVTEDPQTFGWAATGTGRPFEVRVSDPTGRYLTELLAITVPRSTVATPPLYSAVSRPPPAAFAAVSGEVWSSTTTTPAGWAVVQIVADGTTYTTLADQLGRFVVYFPYPEALPPLTGSPPSGGDLLTWALTIWVRYQPSVQNVLADALATDPPELSSLLGQAPATMAGGGASLAATLTYPSPLVTTLEVVPA